MISLNRDEIEALIDLPQAALAIEQAYRATSANQVNLPPVGHIAFPQHLADCHIKYGHMAGDENFVIKVATGFPNNAQDGLSTGNGLVLVLSAQTGQVQAVLHDEMLLTDVRTGLGSAIASRLLARKNARTLLVVGTGPQAQWQIKAHKALMPHLDNIQLWGRNSDRADKAIGAIADIASVKRVDNLAQAVHDTDIIVTATGASSPIIKSRWVKAGTHITAVGADAPGKQELEIDLVARAQLLAVDLINQCVDHGEICHALKAKKIKQSQLLEVGSVLQNPILGRSDDTQISIADLTGIAAQDIAIANAILSSSDLKS